MRPNLLRWQREGYPEFHRDRTNLWLHIFAVPAFIASTVSLVTNMCMMQWLVAGGSALGMGIAFAVQGIGHKREASPPIPFEGPSDAVTRIFVEQFVTFPWFVLTGRWRGALSR